MYFLAVNFHYFGDINKYPYPAIYPISEKDFERQIKELVKFFEFVGQEDILGALNGSKNLPEKSCVLTFDDGLRCQYEIAYKVLVKLGLPGIFYVSALPYREKEACLIHKIHYCRAIIAPEVFKNKIFEHYFSLTGESLDLNADIDRVRNYSLYDDGNTAKLKYILNFLLPYDIKEKIINKIFSEIVDDVGTWVSKWYLEEEQLIELASRNYLGIHSYAHKSLAQMSDKEIRDDLNKSLSYMKDLIDKRVVSISYPFGTPEAVDLRTGLIAESMGLKFGFTMERAININLSQPLLLARLNTNDVPGGSQPLFEMKKNGLSSYKDKLVRQLYK
ncbi:polysaccharide deacetylase family protein [Patescibacteria group bacterium]|nr:polysaccharide deacetylase family protein [Patescibacteria group bacterium]